MAQAIFYAVLAAAARAAGALHLGAAGPQGGPPGPLSLDTVLAAAAQAAGNLAAGALHLGAAGSQATQTSGEKDLVFMHVPYNFGHTIEMVRATSPLERTVMMAGKQDGFSGDGDSPDSLSKEAAYMMNLQATGLKPDYQPWGHLDPKLFAISEISGCPLYFTPQKYWPAAMAEEYFGNKTVFGVLRDPFERLVAEFRGGFSSYGGVDPKFSATCDVNGAIKDMMRSALNSSKFSSSCAWLPQAEYFEGKYGITLPIDNRRFPTSMNEAFKAHGYSEFIRTEDCMHVKGCNQVWAGDLDNEAKALVRQVYAKDFELLCKLFGYCDSEENACLPEVMHMCPEGREKELFRWDPALKRYSDLREA